MLDTILHLMRSVPPWAVVAFAFLIPAAETALVLGLFLPGELAVVAAGIMASREDVVPGPCDPGRGRGLDSGRFPLLAGKKYRTTVRCASHRGAMETRRRAQRRGGPADPHGSVHRVVRRRPAAAGAARFPYRRSCSGARRPASAGAPLRSSRLSPRETRTGSLMAGRLRIVVAAAGSLPFLLLPHAPPRRRRRRRGSLRHFRVGSRRRLPTRRGTA